MRYELNMNDSLQSTYYNEMFEQEAFYLYAIYIYVLLLQKIYSY